MKKYFKFSALAFSTLLLITGCAKDSVAPTIEGVAIMDYDLVQITNDTPNMPINIKANDNDKLSSLSIKVMPDGSSSVTASQEIKNMTASSLTRTSISIPFPIAEKAPSGLYTVEYTLTDAAGNKSTKSYKVNVLNYQTARVEKCEFPAVSLPAGKNVTLFVTAPANTDGDLYVSGNMEQAAGGKGDWTGGGTEALKLTKVSNTCYYIHLNLTSASEFKITRGDWGKVMKTATGGEADNLKWSGQATQNVTVENWADRITLPPVTLPKSAIETNKLTVVADVKNNDAAKYYLVKKGATSLTGAIPMERVVSSTKLAAAVPRETGVEYVLVKDNVASVGVNAYGYEQVASWDGKTNPVNLIIDGYKGSAPLLANNQKLFIVGDATAGGWNNPVPANQEFKRVAEGKFELTLPLQQKEYLLLPVNGDWSFKWGMAGTNPLSGNVNWQGANFKAPAAGTYKIEIDFFKGTYKLTRQ
jgi:hypothetical protein